MSWTVPDCPAGSAVAERSSFATELAPTPDDRVVFRRNDRIGSPNRRIDKRGIGRSYLVMGLLAALTAVSCISSATGPDSTQDSLDEPVPSTGEPGQVEDLVVTNRTSTSATISFTQVDDGYGRPADYVARVQRGPISWGAAQEVVEGSCAAPLKGTAPGQRINCTVNGLEADPGYDFQVVAFRGAFQNGAVYGELSNVASDYSGPLQGPTPSGTHPNEPAGLVRFAEHTFGCLPGNQCGAIGEWNRRDNSNLTIVDDASVPSGKAARLRFPSGGEDGVSYARFDGWGPSMDANGTYQVRELYVSVWLKIEGSSFENQSNGTKVFYIGYGDTDRYNDGYLHLYNGTGERAIQSEVEPNMRLSRMDSNGEDTSAQLLPRNVNSSMRIKAGRWHQVEVYMKANDVNPTVDNGVLRLWVDGVLTTEVTDWRYRSDTNPASFYHMQFTPIWGGHAGDVRTRDDYWRVAGMYMSGR